MKRDRRLLHDRLAHDGLQGIRDNGFTRFVLYRRDVCCPENRSDVEEEGSVSHTPPQTSPAIKGRDYETFGTRTGAITLVQSPVREILDEQSHERSRITYI